MGQSNPLKEPKSSEPDDRLNKILDRWSDIEALIERSGVTSHFMNTAEEYIDDLKTELKSIKFIRWVSILVTLLYIIFLNGIMFYLLVFENPFIALLGGYAKAATVVLVISSSSVLIGKILSGAFKTYGERHKDDYMPPNLKQIIEIINTNKT